MKLSIKSIYFALFISVLCHSSLQAQRSCGSSSLMEKFYQEVPEARYSMEQSIKLWKDYKKNTSRSAVVVTIPVHVIIVHPPGQPVGTGDNLSMERIQSQIDVLNLDFPGLNSDMSGVPSQFAVGSSDITFCLATKDPAGNDSNGITRFATDLEFGSNNFSIMEQTIWDNSSYLNIYVTSTISDLGFSPVASPAYTIPPMWDAPTVLTSTFGGPGYGTLPNYNLGRTAVHEIGHWLGLNHLWGPMAGGCSEDDGIDDTPLQETSTFGCPNHPVASCSSPEIFFNNFMDYVNDDCMLAFSADQVDYMHFIIEQVRPGLIGAHTTNCESIVVPDPIIGTIVSSTNESCSGSNNGSVNIVASGGTGPYSYSLDNGTAQTSGVFNNISGGTHNVVITDALNVTGNISFSIDIGTPILIEVVAVTTPCGNNANGSFGVVASGGNPGGLSITVNQTLTSPNNFFTGLSAASYAIQAADTQGCVEEVVYDLSINNDPFGPITTDILYPTFDACETNLNSVSVQFNLDPSDNINNITLNNGLSTSTGTINGLSTGNYTYMASNAAGCQETGSFVIDQEYYYDISYTATPPSCANSNDGNLLYVNNTNLQISIVMSEGTSTGPTSYNNIGAGVHMVSVYGFGNCLLEERMIDFTVNEISAVVSEISPDCDTGLTDFRITGTGGVGTLNYTFNGTTNTTGFFQHVDPGTHQVIVSDQNNCAQAVTVTIEGVDAPIMVNANVGQETLCFGETTFINVNVQGGAPPYEYILNGVAQNGPLIENIGGGNYQLTVRSASDCAEDFFWEAEVIQNEEITLGNINIIDSECSDQGGRFEADIFDGSQPYYFILDQTETFLAEDLPTLTNGAHSIQAVDANGCTSEIFNFDIIVSEPIGLEVVIENNVSCHGLTDGKVNLIVESNVGVSAYNWNIPNSDFQALAAGEYSLTVTNPAGCSDVANFEITQPEALEVINETLVPAGNLAGSALFEMSGGTPPYQYEVNGIENETGFFSLLQGDYVLNVKDAIGCNLTQGFEITFFSSIENTEETNLTIHPNPANNILKVDCQDCNTQSSYTIYGSNGKQITNGTLNDDSYINIEILDQGIFFIIFNHDQKSTVHKFLVVR